MWKDLTMQQRAELMDIYLGHGITSLDDMRRDYDLRSSNTANTYREGGSIHISPSKKGTFTAAATKHGMGVQEFASKVLAHPENYSPAMRKKANFARNSSKWHGLGGNLYDGLTEGSQQMDNSYSYIKPLSEVIVDNEGNVRDPEVPSARGTIQLPEVTVNTPDWKDVVGRYSIASNDALRVTGLRPQNTHLNKQAEEGAARHAAWARENPGLETAGLIAGAVPFTVAAYPALAGAGELAYPILTNPYVDAGITSAFAGHGLNHAINEGINGWGDAAMTALELAPLGRVAKPIYERVVQPGMRLFNSPLTGNWTTIGNRQYRLNPNSLGANGALLESRSITPQITAENAAKMADANDFSYKGLTSDMSDFFEKMTYNNKIHGKPMVPSDEGIGGFSKSVQVGIPKTEYDELLHDVIGRNIREFKRAGLSDAQVSNYINNAKDAMDNVRIGMYSNSDYIKGGWEGFGGFYDSEGNFISVNTGGPLSKTKVVKHEGRHLLDHKVDDEILMPASENFGKDFDSDIAFSTMQKVKQNQNMTLHDAYDNDFMTLPSKEGYNEGLEGYSNMDREAITTNLDSRNELLGSKADWNLDITDKIIDKMPDTAIFEAVEKANGYGRRYIRFLRDNNKLTPQKARQFREAMKHVGAYAIPTVIAAGTLYRKQE